jgi:hypothetical protein
MIEDLMTQGGYGYDMPGTFCIYIGSDTGRHRAVVVTELVATLLRKILRSQCILNSKSNTTTINSGSGSGSGDGGGIGNDHEDQFFHFRVPCAVGTFHRELQKETTNGSSGSSSSIGGGNKIGGRINNDD